MSDSPLLHRPLWLSLVERACPIAPRSVVFSLPWISQRSRRYVRCFSKIWSCERARLFLQVDCGIVRASDFIVMDVDGTKQAARQRALPSLPQLPPPPRRFDRVGAPAYLGRKRGELVRACQAIISYASWLCMPLSHILVRLDGLYGTGAVLSELLSWGVGVIVRCKEYGLLDLPAVAARLKLPPDHHTTHPESGARRALFDCPDIALHPRGPRVRLIIATHSATSPNKPPVGVLRGETVYELFLTTAPLVAFTCADVLDLYLHRGSFETVLADEDGKVA